MNETVARIVELLFQDVEMNDEVRAIHDEVMNNCQERFGDLLARGLTEDEAIAAVVESLRGMEEVLEGYPRTAEKQAERAGANEAVLGGNGEAVFSAQNLRRLLVNVQGEDVTIEPSPDDEVHVTCNLGESNQHPLVTELEDGELRVTREKSADSAKAKTHVNIDGDFHFDLKDFRFDNLGDMLSKLMRTVQENFNNTGERVCIQIPSGVRLEWANVQTNSGDVVMNDVIAGEVDFSSRSGDVRVSMPEVYPLPLKASFHTTSGDIEAHMRVETVEAQSMSGDIRYEGAAHGLNLATTSGDVRVEMSNCVCGLGEVKSVSGDVHCSGVEYRKLRANTTSGDITVDGKCGSLQFGTVSGDARILSRHTGLLAVEGHTTSGDVTINLPESVREAEIKFHSVSGDVHQGVAQVAGASPFISVNTVSGDLRVQ